MTDTTLIRDDDFLHSAQVRKRYGDRSESWLDRNVKAKHLPQPDLLIGKNRYWRLRSLLDFEEAQKTGA